MKSNNSPVLIEETQNVGIITLNRPKSMNAFEMSMIKIIFNALVHFEKSKSLAIIKSDIPNIFSAGGDIKITTNPIFSFYMRIPYTVPYIMNTCRIPFVAVVDGLVYGGGIGISTFGKYCVVTENTYLAAPECYLGYFPDMCVSYKLSRLSGKLGLYLALTGRKLFGSDIVACGIATHYCESAKIPKLMEKLLECKSDGNVIETLAQFCQVKEKLTFSLDSQMDEINQCFDADSMEGIVRKLQQHNSDWSKGILKTFAKMCPTSLKITYKQINDSATMTLANVVLRDCLIFQEIVKNTNFKMGVHYALVDRTKKPKWDPPTLEEITDEYLMVFFKAAETTITADLDRNKLILKL